MFRRTKLKDMKRSEEGKILNKITSFEHELWKRGSNNDFICKLYFIDIWDEYLKLWKNKKNNLK